MSADGPRASAWDASYQQGTVEEAMRYGSLIWPEFVEMGGMVFLAEEVETQPQLSDVPAALARIGDDRSEMERQWNLVQIDQLFAERAGHPPSEEDLDRLADLLRRTWSAKLKQDFPDWEFVVEVLHDEEDDPTVRFYAVRD